MSERKPLYTDGALDLIATSAANTDDGPLESVMAAHLRIVRNRYEARIDELEESLSDVAAMALMTSKLPPSYVEMCHTIYAEINGKPFVEDMEP
jgi:hypothetical protein